MIIFPEAFPETLLSQFDPSRTTVEWYDFIQCLLKFYHSHFYQGKASRSIRRPLSSRNATASPFSPGNPSSIKTLFFHSVTLFVSTSAICGTTSTTRQLTQISAPDWVRDEKDQSMYRILKFFIPAFIWAYNELKDALLIDEAVMAQSEALIAAHVLIINGKPEVEVNLERLAPNRTRLEVGTAVSARLLAAWKNKAPALKHDLGASELNKWSG